MPRALITGVTGQDGGYLADGLLGDGWEVHGLVVAEDPMLPELIGRAPEVVVHEGDLSDEPAITALVDRLAPDHIYNLGGISSVALSWERPLLTGQVTGLGVGILLEAGWQLQRRLGRQVRILQASSAEIFGEPHQSPQSEETPLHPVNPYGAAKAYAHHLVGVYRARGMHASAVILFNHESPRRPDAFVTRKITKAAALISRGAKERLTLGNLDARRDWGWAPDYVTAMRLAVGHAEPGDYVVATGQARSVRDFVRTAFVHAGITNWESHVEVDPDLVRPVDAAVQVGDATRARTVLGWGPTVTFEEMVARMVDVDLSADGSV